MDNNNSNTNRADPSNPTVYDTSKSILDSHGSSTDEFNNYFIEKRNSILNYYSNYDLSEEEKAEVTRRCESLILIKEELEKSFGEKIDKGENLYTDPDSVYPFAEIDSIHQWRSSQDPVFRQDSSDVQQSDYTDYNNDPE